MKFQCMEDCYFLSTLWKRGELVEGHQFAENKHFAPMDKEAEIEVQAYGREPVKPKRKVKEKLDPELKKMTLVKLRNVYSHVEWKNNMTKTQFIRAIMDDQRQQKEKLDAQPSQHLQ